MIKIAFIKFGGMAIGGTEKVLQTIAAELPKDKFEVDYFYQISEVELRSSLSRFQIVSEFEWFVNKSFGIISGFTWDIQDENSSPSTFLTISITRPIDWYF